MSLAIGALSKSNVTASGATLQAPAATGGAAGAYSYQFYRSTASGFSPAGGNAVGSPITTASAGLVPAAFVDSGLTPGTKYYYKCIVTDSAPATATSAQLEVDTIAFVPSQNQFAQGPFLGQTDMYLNFNTLAVQFDSAGSGTIVGGQALKWVTTASPVPLVAPSTATSDVIAGFANYSIKDQLFNPGALLSMSLSGNVMYLYAALAVSRGNLLTSLPAAVAGGCNGGVVPATGSSGFPVVGQALDTAVIGSLFRVMFINSATKLDS